MNGLWKIGAVLVASAALGSCGGGGSEATGVAPGSLAAIAQLGGNELPDRSTNFTLAADNVHQVYYLAGPPNVLNGASVVRIDASGKVTPVAGPWNRNGICQQAGCPDAKITTDGRGNLYVFWPADPLTGIPTVYKLGSGGEVLSTLELKDQIPQGTIGYPEIFYRYRFGNTGLASMAVNRQGDLFVFDYEGVLWRIGSDGMGTLFAGQDTGEPPRDGSGADARIRPSLAPITIDDAGNLYIPDVSTVRKVTPTGVVTTISVAGTLATGTDAAGAIYVAQGSLCNGQTVAPSGEVKTIVFETSDDGVLCRRNMSAAAFTMTPQGMAAVSFDDPIAPVFDDVTHALQFKPAGALMIFASF